MLQLKNNSPFVPAINVFPDEKGVDTLYVLLKATFDLGSEMSIAEEQMAPVVADEYWGDPTSSSIRYASDVHLCKPSTDVVLNARARTSEGRRTPQLDVRLTVAERQKTLRVFGNREWRQGVPSAPEPFESMPIVYEYAFGGRHEHGDRILGEGRNPVGRGFRGKRGRDELEGLPLPNVEDPQCLVTSSGDKAVPAGFGFVAPAWQPRRDFAGTYDQAWQERRAPYLPDDFDARFFNAAHPDFVFDRHLLGGEMVVLENLSPEGFLRFELPVCQFEAKVDVAGSTERPGLNLETVLVEPEKRRLCMTWRGSMACDKKALKVEQVEVGLQAMQLGRVG